MDFFELLLYIAVFFFLSQGSSLLSKKKKSSPTKKRSPEATPSLFPEDDSTPERETVRKEIQRKIRERSGQQDETPPEETIPPLPPVLKELFEDLAPPELKPIPVAPTSSEIAQREQDKLILANKQREIDRLNEQLKTIRPTKAPCLHTQDHQNIFASLTKRPALQQAFIYQEIFNKPVGMRE